VEGGRRRHRREVRLTDGVAPASGSVAVNGSATPRKKNAKKRSVGGSQIPKSMIPKKPAPDLIRGGYQFSEKIMLKR
jgi:hypothetical protein